MHITSLPSPYGVGTMGREAREFVDFLKKAGQTYWQVLPLGQTGFGDSPYQSCSTYSGNPYMIDLDTLVAEGWLTQEEVDEAALTGSETAVDFAGLYNTRYPLLRKAFERFRMAVPADYDVFAWEQGAWLEDYALFMAIKGDHMGASWDQWERELRMREPWAIAAAKSKLGTEMFFWKMVQYFFFRQWDQLKTYANANGIKIIGDIPIYVAYDGADAWANPYFFDLDGEGKPVEVAGCPPDAFSDDGQLWGNPLYRWDRMRADGYRWWVDRMRHTLKIYDIVRIDHFRGFESYYSVPYGDKTAKNGKWRKGPGMELFDTLNYFLGKMPVIAEDLGLLTPPVRKLLKDSGYPGMKVLQFAFGSGSDNEYLPWHYQKNCVVYTGTHDNDTIRGWWDTLTDLEKIHIKETLHLSCENDISRALMSYAMSTVADTCILTAQDLLELGHEARMNEPSTTGKNWGWRAKKGAFTEGLAIRLYELTHKFDRLPAAEEEEEEWDYNIAIGEILPGQD